MTSQLAVTGFDHVVYVCTDVERVLQWWTGTLGFAAERVDDWRDGRAPFPSVRLSRWALVDLVAGPPSGTNVAHVALDVDAPMAQIQSWLADKGVEVVAGPRDLFGARGTGAGLYVEDPEGNVVELRTYR